VRSNRELWLWLGGLFLTLFVFLVAVAIAYFSKEPHYSLFGNPWMWGALPSFLIAFAAFFGAARTWSFPPIMASGFPEITLEITSIGSTDTERESSTGMDVPVHLRTFHARFTSTERERSASLTVLMYVKLIAGSWGRAGEAVCPAPSWTPSPSLGLNPISMPFELAPGKEVSGQLVYEIPKYHLNKMASPVSARLEIVDYVSGKRVSVPAELGLYDRASMTAVQGGAEILGPEFDFQGATPSGMPSEQRPDAAVELA
jgi:hypothetical protein